MALLAILLTTLFCLLSLLVTETEFGMKCTSYAFIALMAFFMGRFLYMVIHVR